MLNLSCPCEACKKLRAIEQGQNLFTDKTDEYDMRDRQPRAAEQTDPVLEIESRHSDYGEDAGGYRVLKFGGAWIGRIDDREAAKKLIDYVAALKAGKQCSTL